MILDALQQAIVALWPNRGARVHFAAFPEPNGIRFGQNRNPFGSVENLLRVRDFTDVALVSEGETKNGAHKVILISASHRKIQ